MKNISYNNFSNTYCLFSLVNSKLIGGGQDKLVPYNKMFYNIIIKKKTMKV